MSEPSAPRPSAGARFVVHLSSWDGDTAVYEGAAHLPGASLPLRVEVSASGGRASIDREGGRPDLERAALALVRAAAKLPRAPEAGPPPRRISRWRA